MQMSHARRGTGRSTAAALPPDESFSAGGGGPAGSRKGPLLRVPRDAVDAAPSSAPQPDLSDVAVVAAGPDGDGPADTGLAEHRSGVTAAPRTESPRAPPLEVEAVPTSAQIMQLLHRMDARMSALDSAMSRLSSARSQRSVASRSRRSSDSDSSRPDVSAGASRPDAAARGEAPRERRGEEASAKNGSEGALTDDVSSSVWLVRRFV